jgi:C1A family cysteine protease
MRIVNIFGITVFMLAIAAVASGVSIEERELQGRFNGWMRQHARSYDSGEFLERYNIWRDNMAFVEEFNRSGDKTFTVAMNQYGDLEPEEFARLYKGHVLPADQEEHMRKRLETDALDQEQELQEAATVGATLPSSWSWTAQGAVIGVENQGACLSCWAFAAAGALESARKIANYSLVPLSKQQLVDCSGSAGNLGCNGGNVGLAYNWMRRNDAKLMSEASYPYTGKQSTCRYTSASQGIAAVKNYASVKAGSEADLLANAAVGPVTVAIDSARRSYIYYSGGYYYDQTCSTTYLDHAVLVVGWGSDPTYGDYWLVKNQWGASWGESGYMKMARNRNNNCGIASLAVRPCLEATCSTTPNVRM